MLHAAGIIEQGIDEMGTVAGCHVSDTLAADNLQASSNHQDINSFFRGLRPSARCAFTTFHSGPPYGRKAAYPLPLAGFKNPGRAAEIFVFMAAPLYANTTLWRQVASLSLAPEQHEVQASAGVSAYEVK